MTPPIEIPKTKVGQLNFKFGEKGWVYVANSKFFNKRHPRSIRIIFILVGGIDILIRVIVFRWEKSPGHYKLLILILFQISFKLELSSIVGHIYYICEVLVLVLVQTASVVEEIIAKCLIISRYRRPPSIIRQIFFRAFFGRNRKNSEISIIWITEERVSASSDLGKVIASAKFQRQSEVHVCLERQLRFYQHSTIHIVSFAIIF